MKWRRYWASVGQTLTNKTISTNVLQDQFTKGSTLHIAMRLHRSIACMSVSLDLSHSEWLSFLVFKLLCIGRKENLVHTRGTAHLSLETRGWSHNSDCKTPLLFLMWARFWKFRRWTRASCYLIHLCTKCVPHSLFLKSMRTRMVYTIL